MNKIAEIKKFKNLNYYALLIFFVVSVIYLFPSFLGKVDTPCDIRDMRMYPWRYYMVDKKIKMLTLWEGDFSRIKSPQFQSINGEIFKWTTSKDTFTSIDLNINLSSESLKKLTDFKDSNYFISFDFKPEYDSSVAFSFGPSLINRATGAEYTPGVAVVPVSSEDGSTNWYKAQFPLNNFLSKQSSVNNINQFDIRISANNKSKTSAASIQIKNLKIGCEDFSKITKAHNHFNNDLIQMFTPFREYFSNSIKSGRLPFWNNYILSGAEFIAEPQVGYFHPFYFILYFLFDHFTAHQILTFLCILFAGFGAYLLSREWNLNHPSSVLTGIVFMFQPFNATWMSYEHMIMNSAAMPFLILFYEKALKQNRLINKNLIASAVLLGLIFLSGHFQYIYYSAIFFFLFAFFRFLVCMFSDRKSAMMHVFSFLFVFVFGLLIGSITILPFLNMFKISHRTENPLDLVKATSVPLKAFIGLLHPYYLGIPDWPLAGLINRTKEFEDYKLGFMRNYVYFGFLPFIISLFSFVSLFRKQKISIFFFMCILFSLLMCTGTPLFFMLRSFMPGFKEMQHYRFLQIFSYSVPFLAGMGFQVFQDLVKPYLQNMYKTLVNLIIIISAIDLMYFSSFFVTWSDRKDYKPIPEEGVLQFILNEQKKSKEPFRILPFSSHKVEGALLKPDIAEPNTLLPYGIEDASGYSSFIPKDIYYMFVYIQTKDYNKLYSGKIFDLFSNINTPYPISNFHSRILDLLNVKYFVVPNFLTVQSEKVNKIFSGDAVVYENKRYLPRAFFVTDYRVIISPKDVIVELDKNEFDPLKEVIFTKEPDALLNSKTENKVKPAYEIKFLNYEAENIKLNVKTNQKGYLILGHNLNENWKVTINNNESNHYQANLVQRAVYLPKEGDYTIEFYYYPKLFFIGLSLTLASLIILLLITFWVLIVRKMPHNKKISSVRSKEKVTA